jgi:hypothetical protein
MSGHFGGLGDHRPAGQEVPVGRRGNYPGVTKLPEEVAVDLTPGEQDGRPVPGRQASFAEKMDYYRSQHTTKGIRATHVVGIPGVAFAIPLVFGRPKVGLPMFAASWALQVLGHKVFEKNNPALTKGFFTFQFCGLAFWCEEMVDLIAGKGMGGTQWIKPAPPQLRTVA